MARLALGVMFLAVAGADMQCTLEPGSAEACPQDQVTDASTLLQKVVGVQLHAAGSIQRTIDSYCKLLHATQGRHMFPKRKEARQDISEFQGLFAGKIECSGDPANPDLGFHLKHATFGQCFGEANREKTSENKRDTVSKAACIQSIVDESKGTAVVVQDIGKTGGDGYMVRNVIHLAFNEKGQITTYNAIYDSYGMLPGAQARPNAEAFEPAKGEIGVGMSDMQHTIDQYCKALHKLQEHHDHVFPDPAEAEQDTREFQSLFADTMECSEDPLNPVVGFHLKDVTLKQCFMAWSANKKYSETMEKAACIQSIVDESKGTAVVVQDIGKRGDNGYMVRGTMLLAFNKKGQITTYHAVYDSYHMLKFKK